MNARTPNELLAPADGESCNPSSNPSLSQIVEARLSRRNILRVGVGSAGAAVLAACGGNDDAVATAPAPAPAPVPTVPAPPLPTAINLSFTAVAKNKLDAVTVPAGYTARPIYALGDPLTAATPDFKNDGTDTDYKNRAGDHHDGIGYFGLNAAGTARDAAGSQRGLLAMNHEALTAAFLFPAGTSANPRPAAEALKEIEAHGISVVEVSKTHGAWAYNKASNYNRRVTPLDTVLISGPARGSDLMRTAFSTDGTQARGTLGNCGTGTTPWGTFLTAEENFAGFFARSTTDGGAGVRTARENLSFARYGRNAGAAAGRGWNTSGAADAPRWNVSKIGVSADGTDDFRNELNTFGYMVEIDPYDKTAAVRKRTGLGRFAHESATFGLLTAGKPVAVYMGDDQAGDYIYKYVSAAAWSAADANPANRITTGDRYLDNGKLYVAKFNADGSGQWIELTTTNPLIAAHPYGFVNQAEVVVNARLAADAVGATRMDRPEWCAVHPVTGEVYYTLTNNSSRTPAAVDAANPRSYSDTFDGGAAKPNQNVNGHIIRLRENNGDHTAVAFAWDVYLFGAEASMDDVKIDLSSLTDNQDFSSPDGLWFSQKTGLMFIQTDDGNYTDVTNCMMLIAKPGKVGDGAAVTISGVGGTAANVTTYVGAKPTADTLRRFLVGPVDCEITGITETPDGRTIFVNIQHPGDTVSNATVGNPDSYTSHWPANAGYGAGGATTARPRSATVAVTRNDGGLIGTDGTAVLNAN